MVDIMTIVTLSTFRRSLQLGRFQHTRLDVRAHTVDLSGKTASLSLLSQESHRALSCHGPRV